MSSVSWEVKAVGSVRPSARLFPLLSFEPTDLSASVFCVWVMTIAGLGLKVKVIDQGLRSMSNTYGRGNAVGLTRTV